MEHFFSLEYGIAGLCVLLTLGMVLRVVEFLWGLRERKDNLSEASINALTDAVTANTRATQHLEHRLGVIEKSVSDLPKFKNDMRRFYAAIKEVAGDNWPRIRDVIMKDDFTL